MSASSLCALLGVKAPMLGVHAGALGSIALAASSPDQAARLIAEMAA